MDYLLMVLLFYGYVLKTGGQVFLTGKSSNVSEVG